MMRLLLFLLVWILPAAAQTAKNVVLFLADGVGPSTVNAASIHGYAEPRRLFVQNLPHIGLSETSAASSWVTDSAAGMTAIVTGQKTHNGVISQSASAVRGSQDGEPLKTILEYAEERGLATGVVSNSPMADATPAACYAHSNDRAKWGEIFSQVLKPRFGDGVDVILGPGRAQILEQTSALGIDLATALPAKGLPFFDSLSAIPVNARRAVALFPNNDFDLQAAANVAIDILSRNPRGFFLMVESNNHSLNVQRVLDGTVAFDRLIQGVAGRLPARDTLLLFTADHSFDLRLPGGAQRGEEIVSKIRVANSHTGEEVLVGARGPGAERVRGIMPNTQLFHIMMQAYGWKPDGAPPAAAKKSAGGS